LKRKSKRGKGKAQDQVIRIKKSVRADLNFIKKNIGLSLTLHNEGDVVEQLISMFKAKHIGNLTTNKGDNVLFLADKEIEERLKDSEYVVKMLQQNLDNWIFYFDTACKIGHLKKSEVIDFAKQQIIKT